MYYNAKNEKIFWRLPQILFAEAAFQHLMPTNFQLIFSKNQLLPLEFAGRFAIFPHKSP
jgi:hypothetical protein